MLEGLRNVEYCRANNIDIELKMLENKNTYMDDEERYKKKFEQIVKDINLQQVIIAEKQKETVNIGEAVKNIK